MVVFGGIFGQKLKEVEHEALVNSFQTVDFMCFIPQEKYNFALVTNHFSSEAESLKFGDTLKRIRAIDNFQVR